MDHIIYEVLPKILEYTSDNDAIRLLKTCRTYYNDRKIYQLKYPIYQYSELANVPYGVESCKISHLDEFRLYQKNNCGKTDVLRLSNLTGDATRLQIGKIKKIMFDCCGYNIDYLPYGL